MYKMASFLQVVYKLTIEQELAQVSANPVEGTVVRLPDENNIFLWEAKMTAPADSVYAVSPSQHDVTVVLAAKLFAGWQIHS